MAIIHHGKNELQEKLDVYEEKRSKNVNKHVVITVILIVISLILSADGIRNAFMDWAYGPGTEVESFGVSILIALGITFSHPLQWLFRYIIPLALIVNLISNIRFEGKRYDKEQIIQAGLESEKAAVDCLSALPDAYHIFTNLHIPYDGQTSEADLVVVGPTGVHIIEVKGHKGTIAGDWNDKHLRHFKGENVSPPMYNPVKQVATHVYRLSGFLKERHICTWINGYVYFTNPEIEFDITDDKNKGKLVFTYQTRDQLLKYIQTSKQQISSVDISTVVNLLCGLIDQQKPNTMILN